MKSNQSNGIVSALTGPIAFNLWLRQSGVTPVTGWRWRKAGMITTVNISGRQYVTPEAIAEFTRRAEAGEFSKVHQTPQRKKEKAAA